MKELTVHIASLDKQLSSKGLVNIPGNDIGDFLAANTACPNCRSRMGVFRLYKKDDNSKEGYIICGQCFAIKKMESPKYWTQAIMDQALVEEVQLKDLTDDYINEEL